jgi:hypothetical protein
MSIDQTGDFGTSVPVFGPPPASGVMVRGHYLLDGAARRLLQKSIPGQLRRRLQWAALFMLISALFLVNDSIRGGLVVYVGVIIGLTIGLPVVFRQRMDALPSVWIGIEIGPTGIRVSSQTTDYPTSGGGTGDVAPAPTGTRSTSTTDMAWDLFTTAVQNNGCWVLTQTTKKFLVMPLSAFNDADTATIGQLLAGRGLRQP